MRIEEELARLNLSFLDNPIFGDNSSNYSNAPPIMIDYPLSDDDRDNLIGDLVLIVSYAVLVITSVFGNTLVCHVILQNKRMHTVTNYFIANLAVSDLLLTFLNVPFNIARHMMNEWVLGDVLCHMVNFSMTLSVYVSTFTLTGIALDRQQVLLYPLSPRMTTSVALVVLALIWLVGTGLSLPYGLYTRIKSISRILFRPVRRCTYDFPEPTQLWEQCLTVATILLQYVLPLTIISITYGRIVWRLWGRTHVGAVTENQQLSQARAKRKSIKMLITVVIVFALCWMPLNLYHLLTDLHPDTELFHSNSSAFFICHWIAASSTCYNPFVYCWLNETFRKEVKARFIYCYRRSQRIHPGAEVEGILLRADKAKRVGSSRGSHTRSSVYIGSLRLSFPRRSEVSVSDHDREETDLLSFDQMTSPTTLSTGVASWSTVLNTVPEETSDLLPKSKENVMESDASESYVHDNDSVCSPDHTRTSQL